MVVAGYAFSVLELYRCGKGNAAALFRAGV